MKKLIEIVRPSDIKGDVYLACSGGVDSVVLFHILLKMRTNFEVLFYNHGADHNDEEFVTKLCHQHNVPIHIGYNDTVITSSFEEHWRDARYAFFEKFADRPVLLGHNLDDVMETYAMSFESACPKIMPYARRHCIRPMLIATKQNIIDYAVHNNISWYETVENSNTAFKRVNVRKNIIPTLKTMFPSLLNTLRKHIIKRDRNATNPKTIQ